MSLLLKLEPFHFFLFNPDPKPKPDPKPDVFLASLFPDSPNLSRTCPK